MISITPSLHHQIKSMTQRQVKNEVSKSQAKQLCRDIKDIADSNGLKTVDVISEAGIYPARYSEFHNGAKVPGLANFISILNSVSALSKEKTGKYYELVIVEKTTNQ